MGRFKSENTDFKSKICVLKPILQGNWLALGGLPVFSFQAHLQSGCYLFICDISTCISCSMMLVEIFTQTEQNEHVKSRILYNHHT